MKRRTIPMQADFAFGTTQPLSLDISVGYNVDEDGSVYLKNVFLTDAVGEDILDVLSKEDLNALLDKAVEDVVRRSKTP